MEINVINHQKKLKISLLTTKMKIKLDFPYFNLIINYRNAKSL